MFTRGEFTSNNVTYGAILYHTKAYTEAILITSGTVVSAYKVDSTGSYSYNNIRAKEMVQMVQSGVKGCTSKNCVPMPFILGAMNQHNFIKSKVEYTMQMYRGEVVGAFIQSADKRVELEYLQEYKMPANIPYIKLTEIKKDIDVAETDLDAIKTRSVQEIALEKEDITWLQNKKYYIVNDDETAEKLFEFLDNYNGVIAYDTETTGLKINVFGQINSSYQHTLIKYNEEHPDEQIRADKLVGIIFCVEDDVSYYFPCFNRKFENLYEKLDSPIRNRIINNTKSRYTIGNLRNETNCVAEYWRKTPANEITPDCILMERVRDILETKHLVAHNGTFEWKVGFQYWIDTNIKDDTMILHQLMYKFRSTTSNRGEPSNLKYLAKRELGIDQWELSDFFPDWKADKDGLVRSKKGSKKKKGSNIDFSYMDYEGTRVYAPTDGDVTFQLFKKYKSDMVKNHKKMNYLYDIEVIVSCAVAYMEFYGHKLDEDKILGARTQTRANIVELESQIRQLIKYSDDKEINAFNTLKDFRSSNSSKTMSSTDYDAKLLELTEALEKSIADNTDNVLNLASPAQVCDLFYNKLEITFTGDKQKQSVAKKEIKALLKEKNDDGTLKYPVVKLYSDYKNESTLMTKFFDNLPYFMYPGGYIFSSYGQISTATGRMSCIEENAEISVVGGKKAIKDIKVGDLVYCYDNEGNLRIRKVLNVIDNGEKECIRINWKSTGNGSKGSLICTPDHKILSKENGWVRADSLARGDRVYHLNECEHTVLSWKDHPNYKNITADELIDMLKKANGVVSNLPIDYTTFVKKCKEYDIDYITLSNNLKGIVSVSDDDIITAFNNTTGAVYAVANYLGIGRTQAEKRMIKLGLISKETSKVVLNITDEEFINNFMQAKGSIRGTARLCGITFLKAKKKIEELDLAYNHMILNSEACGKHHVYDLEVEEFHNFIANEICVHNCSKPNAQQYPKVITKIVAPRPGYVMIDADYSQIEYRVLTAMAKNDWLAELFSDPDSDYHTLMASLMYDVPYSSVTSSMRSAAKSFNFGIPYGMGLGSLAILLTGKNTPQTRDEAAEKYEDYFRNQPKTRKFFENVKEMAQVNGYTKTLFDRYRYYSFTDKDGNIDNFKKASALRQAGNAVIQGCLDGNTRIQTKEFGIMKIKDLVGYSGEVWDGEKWSHGDILYSGKKQKCIITFNNGQKFICSPIHKFLKAGTSAKNESNYTECKDLKQGDKIAINWDSDLQVNIAEEVKQKFEYFCSGLKSDADETCIDSPLYFVDLTVESVEITDEYIDMYDVCNTDGGYYVADGIITHNTAADIFKIGVARNFIFIRRNKLFGEFLIINMVHDEQLMEVNAQNLNVQRILAEVGQSMQFEVENFPPLYIGAGVGKAWGLAKGKMAEIHPVLLQEMTEEAKKIPIWRSEEERKEPVNLDEIYNYFDSRVYEFRRKKVADYLSNPDNWNQAIHPAIGGLINLQFNYGRGDDAKNYVGPNGETYTDQEFLEMNISDFLKENNINAEASYFKATELKDDKEEDKGYTDDEEELDEFDMLSDEEEDVKAFTLVDESDKLFGSSIHDMIDVFGTCIIKQQKICGINTKNMYYKDKDAIINYLMQYICEEDDEDALQIVFLADGNILKYTGIYVKNIDNDKFESMYKEALTKETDFTEGDVKNRSQAK